MFQPLPHRQREQAEMLDAMEVLLQGDDVDDGFFMDIITAQESWSLMRMGGLLRG
jgi:hypothetical protein